jgi:hypothetical protein
VTKTEWRTGSSSRQLTFLTDIFHRVVMVKLSFALLGTASLVACIRGQEVSIGSLSGGLPPGEGPPLPPPVRPMLAVACLETRSLSRSMCCAALRRTCSLDIDAELVTKRGPSHHGNARRQRLHACAAIHSVTCSCMKFDFATTWQLPLTAAATASLRLHTKLPLLERPRMKSSRTVGTPSSRRWRRRR